MARGTRRNVRHRQCHVPCPTSQPCARPTSNVPRPASQPCARPTSRVPCHASRQCTTADKNHILLSHGHIGRASSFAKATEDKDARPSRGIAHISTGDDGAHGGAPSRAISHGQKASGTRDSSGPRGARRNVRHRQCHVPCPMSRPADGGGEGSRRPTIHFSTGTLAEQTLGPPAAFSTGTAAAKGLAALPYPFPRATTARTEARHFHGQRRRSGSDRPTMIIPQPRNRRCLRRG